MKTTYDRDVQKRQNIEEEKKELAENLKTQQKTVKKNREIVNELEKLSG